MRSIVATRRRRPRAGHGVSTRSSVVCLPSVLTLQDGTKGFLRGGQYAVCLALIEDGHPVLGVVGCPNLPVDPSQPDGAKGVIFSAVKGSGAVQRSLTDATESSIRMSALSSLADASFCESVESGHSDQGTNAKIASILGITKPSVRMDSQAKYCSVARADGDIYLRLPVSASYQEKIWDHVRRRLADAADSIRLPAPCSSPRRADSSRTATDSRSTLRKGGRSPRTRASSPLTPTCTRASSTRSSRLCRASEQCTLHPD